MSGHQKSTLLAPWTAGCLLGRPGDGPGGVGEDPAGPAGLALDGDGTGPASPPATISFPTSHSQPPTPDITLCGGV